MSDLLSDDTKVILLLCATLGNGSPDKPLTISEYSLLVHWLIKKKMRPGDLLAKANIAEASMESSLDRYRLESLLNRGVQLAIAVEEWQRNGIWIISRSDADYPVRYKRHLKDKAPPLLFGVGDRALLCGGGLGVVGSRNVDEEGAAFTRHVAELCANQTIPVVSGGARGVDQISMQTAVEAGGTTIGILAENLLKRSVERYTRHAIAAGRMLLISPYHPNAHFSVRTAMERNKLIYALSDFCLVVSAEYKKGGTWSGAAEELRREHPKDIFVRTGGHVPHGNIQLLNLGAIPWPESVANGSLRQQLSDIINRKVSKVSDTSNNLSLLDYQPTPSTANVKKSEPDDEPLHKEVSNGEASGEAVKKSELIYRAVLPIILNELDSSVTSKALPKILNVNKPQLDAWLKKAVEEGLVEKFNRPTRYKKKVENQFQLYN